jgi:hypothetical protein
VRDAAQVLVTGCRSSTDGRGRRRGQAEAADRGRDSARDGPRENARRDLEA